jgi:hypothetical protein
LDQALQLDPRLVGISLKKDLTLLDISFFIFFMQEKKNKPVVYDFVFFLFFFFLSFLLWTA